MAVVGLAVGSFLNVVVWRVPRGESVVAPGSHCPSCAAAVRTRDNVPVLSWLLLRGRCRDCGTPISLRYPLVELLTAAVFVVLGARLGASWELPAYLYLGALGVALALIDLDVKRLPNVLVLPAYAVAPLLLTVPAVLDDRWPDLGRALLGGAALYAGYFALAFAYPAGMGFGDVKLAGVLGIYLGWLGWGPLAAGAFLGFLLGGVVGVALLAGRRATRKTAIPYGPFMLVGALLGVLAGSSITGAYLDVIGV
nr:A24 family peptidase [Motilibacter aurantiacus]